MSVAQAKQKRVTRAKIDWFVWRGNFSFYNGTSNASSSSLSSQYQSNSINRFSIGKPTKTLFEMASVENRLKRAIHCTFLLLLFRVSFSVCVFAACFVLFFFCLKWYCYYSTQLHNKDDIFWNDALFIQHILCVHTLFSSHMIYICLSPTKKNFNLILFISINVQARGSLVEKKTFFYFILRVKQKSSIVKKSLSLFDARTLFTHGAKESPFASSCLHFVKKKTQSKKNNNNLTG